MAEPVMWLEVSKLVVTTIASVVVGGIAIRISMSQRDISAAQASTALTATKVASAKLNLDLFRHRYEMFDLAVQHVMLEAGRTPEENSKKIAELEAWFLEEATFCFKRFAEYLDFSSWKAA